MSDSQKALDRLAAHVPSWLTVLALITAMVIVVSAAGVLIYGAITGKVAKAFGIEFRPPGGIITGGIQLPEGAVLAVDRGEGCPDGWSDITRNEEGRNRFAGRVLVVAGPAVDNEDRPEVNGGTQARAFAEEGGQERVTLGEGQLPSHRHEMQLSQSAVYGPGTTRNATTTTDGEALTTASSGGGESHENMPPFIALHFCKKA